MSRAAAGATALLCVALAAAAGAESRAPVLPSEGDLTLETLMQRMSTTPGVIAPFREHKEVALLDAPLAVEGTIYFVPPDRMVRRTSRPGASVLVLDGDRLRFRDEAGGDDFDLSASPEARHFVDNFIVLFNGDLAALRDRYRVEFEASGAHWRLALVPRRAPVRDFIDSITLRGDGTALREMVMVETDGDRTTTVFDATDVEHRFSAEEIRALFAPPDAASPEPPSPGPRPAR